MCKYLRYVILSTLLFSLAIAVMAQETYTFESGAQFVIPEGVILDDSGAIPALIMGEQTLMDVVDPAVIGDTLNAPLDEVLDFLLGAVGYTDERTAQGTSRFTLDDEREVMGYDFINASGATQSIIVVRLSDGRVGALNFRSLETVTPEMVNTMLAVTSSLDVPTENVIDVEAELTAGLAQEHTYDTGVSFRFPADFVIVNADDPPATIGIENVILITMVDPSVVGMPAGESMTNIIDFAIESSPLSLSDFAPLDIGRREAVLGTAEKDGIYQSMVLVRFDDDTVGIMDILTVEPPTAVQTQVIRQVAASFNSAGTEAAITAADIDNARQLFQEAMGLRDEGDYEAALDLFDQAIASNPNLGLAYYWRAATRMRFGDLEGTVADYRQALAIAPEEQQIRFDISDAYGLYGEVELAIAEIEAYIEEVGEDNLPENQAAILEVYQQIANGEYNGDYYYSQANRFRTYGLYERALESNQVAIDNEPDDPLLYAQRGVIYLEAEQLDEAIESFTDGIAIEPLPVLFYNRGYAYSLAQDFDSIINKVHDYQCMLLLVDDSITQEQIDFAERGINLTIIDSDTYEPITDAANCTP